MDPASRKRVDDAISSLTYDNDDDDELDVRKRTCDSTSNQPSPNRIVHQAGYMVMPISSLHGSTFDGHSTEAGCVPADLVAFKGRCATFAYGKH